MTFILEDKLIKAEFRQPQQYFRAVLRIGRIKDPIVSYLRELGSAEGSVADTRDKKEWKSSSLHSRDLKAHKQLECNWSIETLLLMMILMNYAQRSDLIDKGGWLTWLSLCPTFSSWRPVCSHWQWHLVAVQWHYTSWWLQKSTAIKSVFTLKNKQKHDYKRLLISVLDIMLATCQFR